MSLVPAKPHVNVNVNVGHGRCRLPVRCVAWGITCMHAGMMRRKRKRHRGHAQSHGRCPVLHVPSKDTVRVSWRRLALQVFSGSTLSKNLLLLTWESASQGLDLVGTYGARKVD